MDEFAEHVFRSLEERPEHQPLPEDLRELLTQFVALLIEHMQRSWGFCLPLIAHPEICYISTPDRRSSGGYIYTVGLRCDLGFRGIFLIEVIPEIAKNPTQARSVEAPRVIKVQTGANGSIRSCLSLEEVKDALVAMGHQQVLRNELERIQKEVLLWSRVKDLRLTVT